MKFKMTLLAMVASMGFSTVAVTEAQASDVSCKMGRFLPVSCTASVIVPKSDQQTQRAAAYAAAEPILKAHVKGLDSKYRLKSRGPLRGRVVGNKVKVDVTYSLDRGVLKPSRIKQMTSRKPLHCERFEGGRIYRCHVRVKDWDLSGSPVDVAALRAEATELLNEKSQNLANQNGRNYFRGHLSKKPIADGRARIYTAFIMTR